MRIHCRTLFDITATGITGHYKPSRIPFQDQAGNQITTVEAWNRSRNCQRNWETMVQLISLRTQVESFLEPKKIDSVWQFEFEINNNELFLFDNDKLGILKQDFNGVPMLVGLGEIDTIHSWIAVDQNTWFEILE